LHAGKSAENTVAIKKYRLHDFLLALLFKGQRILEADLLSLSCSMKINHYLQIMVSRLAATVSTPLGRIFE
jgi:hypothetical protein